MADIDEFGVHYIVLAAVILAVTSAVLGRRLSVGLGGSRFVHGLCQFVAGGREAVSGSVDPVRVILPNGSLGLFESRFDFPRRPHRSCCDVPSKSGPPGARRSW